MQAGGRMTTTDLTVLAPEAFSFAGTVHSHGWAVLAPHAWDPDAPVLERVHRLPTGRVVLLGLRPRSGSGPPAVAVAIRQVGALEPHEEASIRGNVRRMLRLDEDLSDFHRACRRRGGRWARVAEDGLGRLLRSPTVFEDVVKTICTTNVQWAGTKRMVAGLVEVCGAAAPEAVAPPAGRRRAFPTPEAVAAVDAGTLREEAGLGYRAPYVHELARRVASGDLELEALADSELPTRELERELRDIRGVGPYAAATLLMLLGRYDVLAVDSVFRSFVADRYFGGETPDDDEARAVYRDWGRWRFLAYWYDLWQGTEEEL